MRECASSDLKERWIEKSTSGICASANRSVIAFIAEFRMRHGYDSDDVYDLFANGYCFYFATILHTAFSRGEVCWHRCHGHIVWRDTDGQTYDIGGLFLDADPEDILPVDSSLGSMVVDFLHNGDEFKSTDPDFNEWAKLQDSTPVVALSTIYRIIPADERNDSESVEKNVLVYWRKHRSDIESIYNGMKLNDLNLNPMEVFE